MWLCSRLSASIPSLPALPTIPSLPRISALSSIPRIPSGPMCALSLYLRPGFDNSGTPASTTPASTARATPSAPAATWTPSAPATVGTPSAAPAPSAGTPAASDRDHYRCGRDRLVLQLGFVIYGLCHAGDTS